MAASAQFRRTCLALLAVTPLLLAAPRIASAQLYNWLVPAGGESWTAGTTHTVAWSGGPPVNASAFLFSVAPFQQLGPVALNVPFSLPAFWAIPANLPPGQYQLMVQDVTSTVAVFSNTFTINAPPPCAPGCSRVAIAPEDFGGYPGVHCGTDPGIAMTNAQNWLNTQLASACLQDWYVDPGAMATDWTPLPVGSCYVGQFGGSMVEVSFVGCCCPGPTETRQGTWGELKIRYR